MFLKHLFRKEKKETQYTAEEFWKWFAKKQAQFFKQVKESHGATPEILSEVLAKAQLYHPGIYGLMGFVDDTTLEFVFSADGEIKNFVFVEELVAQAPTFKNWLFTDLKPKITQFDPVLTMNELVFSQEKLHFYTQDDENYPDEIDVYLVHEAFVNPEDHQSYLNGSLLYLDNALGELDFSTKIDYIDLVTPAEVPAGTDLIPIQKLSDYIRWREAEFLQKYEPIRLKLPVNEEMNLIDAEVDGYPFLGIIGSCWLDWHYKPYYSWSAKVFFTFEGQANGFPKEKQLLAIQEAETALIEFLSPLPICHIGRTTFQNESTVFLYANEYKKLSNYLYQFTKAYSSSEYEMEYHIYRDKYWRSVEQYL